MVQNKDMADTNSDSCANVMAHAHKQDLYFRCALTKQTIITHCKKRRADLGEWDDSKPKEEQGCGHEEGYSAENQDNGSTNSRRRRNRALAVPINIPIALRSRAR